MCPDVMMSCVLCGACMHGQMYFYTCVGPCTCISGWARIVYLGGACIVNNIRVQLCVYDVWISVYSMSCL